MSKNQLRQQRKAPTGAILRMGAAELKTQGRAPVNEQKPAASAAKSADRRDFANGAAELKTQDMRG